MRFCLSLYNAYGRCVAMFARHLALLYVSLQTVVSLQFVLEFQEWRALDHLKLQLSARYCYARYVSKNIDILNYNFCDGQNQLLFRLIGTGGKKKRFLLSTLHAKKKNDSMIQHVGCT